MDGLLQDLRYALRQLGKSPTFTVAGIVILALGIGANAAIFSALYALLLNPFRFPESNRIVVLDARHESGNNRGTGYRDFLDWQAQNGVFEDMAILPWTGKYTLTGQGEAQSVVGGHTTARLLQVLRVPPYIGRFFSGEEDTPGAEDVAVLSYAAWQRRFAGDPGILGRTITLDAKPFTIVGVLPKRFALPGIQTCEFLAPLKEESAGDRNQHQYEVVARLKPAVALTQAQANMTAIARQLELQHPDTNLGWSVAVLPIREAMTEDAKKPLAVLFSAVVFVLLLTCVNVAGLLLARASKREREIAIRISMGANRLRIVRQMLTESVLLAVGGGALGLLIACWLMRVLRAAAPAELALDAMLHLDPTVLLYTLAVSVLTGIVFGLAPAWYGTRANVYASIKSGAMGSGSRAHGMFLSWLVIGQVALSSVLLVGAGLLAKNLYLILRLDTGLRTRHVLTFVLDLPNAMYSSPQRTAEFFQELLTDLRTTRGIDDAAAVSTLPMTSAYSGGPFEIDDRAKPADWMDMNAQFNTSTPGYFHLMGIPILLGRDFDERDTAGSLPIAVINDTLGRRFFGSQNPVGHRIRLGGDWRMIVGVTGSFRHQNPTRDPVPMVYVPHAQAPHHSMTITVLSAANPGQVAAIIRKIVKSKNPNLPILDLRTMQDVVNDSMSDLRLITFFLGGFAASSLLLAATGIYGLLAYSVMQRMQEMGVRLALGASPADLLRLVLGKGVLLAAGGVAFGIPAALIVSQFLRSLLYGISFHDPTIFIGVPAAMFSATLAASYIPALRAAKADPIQALRSE